MIAFDLDEMCTKNLLQYKIVYVCHGQSFHSPVYWCITTVPHV